MLLQTSMTYFEWLILKDAGKKINLDLKKTNTLDISQNIFFHVPHKKKIKLIE